MGERDDGRDEAFEVGSNHALTNDLLQPRFQTILLEVSLNRLLLTPVHNLLVHAHKSLSESWNHRETFRVDLGAERDHGGFFRVDRAFFSAHFSNSILTLSINHEVCQILSE